MPRWAMKMLLLFINFVSVIIFAVDGTSTNGCIGSSLYDGCDCSRVELFSDDTLYLQTHGTHTRPETWCNQMIIVRQTMQNYDTCTGCTLKVEFLEVPSSGAFSMSLLEANYTASSFYASEILTLTSLAEYGGGSRQRFPTSIDTTGTVLKFVYGGSDYNAATDGNLRIRVSSNIPRTSSVTIVVAITVPLLVLFITFYVVIYKLRQRRMAAARAALQSRVNALVLDAVMDAELLRQARARQQQRAPRSPDPLDSVAPPSYTEAAPPPPKYEDVVSLDSSAQANRNQIEMVDSAGPDRGRDTDMLVV